MVFCGAESGSTDTLKRMNKGGTAAAELTLELARRMKSFGIVPEFSFVVGNPPDPEADLAQTLAFIRRVKHDQSRAEIILYVYSPVPTAQRSTGSPFPRRSTTGSAIAGSRSRCAAIRARRGRRRRSADASAISRPC